MAGGPLGGIRRVSNQILETVYDPGSTVKRRSTATGPTSFRHSALIWADILSSFALYVMMNYLTDVWNLSTANAAGIINIFNGITPALAIVFAFSADTFLGDFYMLALSSIAYSVGLGLLSLSTPPFFGPCSHYDEECIGHSQKVLFFTGLLLIQAGSAGHLVSLSSVLALQAEAEVDARNAILNSSLALAETALSQLGSGGPAEAEAAASSFLVGATALLELLESDETLNSAFADTEVEAEEDDGSTFFLIYILVVTLVTAAAAIALPHIKPWSIRFGIPAICTLTATAFFLIRSSRYKHDKPEGSPLTIALRVFAAAATKDFQQVKKFTETYTEDETRSTEGLRWLDKAAIRFPDQARSKSWTLCSVREVEDTKTGIRMVPMLLTSIGTGVVLSLGTTYFLEQADHMDHTFGHIKIPNQVFLCIFVTSRETAQFICNHLEQHIPRKYFSRAGIAIGKVLSVLCCVTAAIVEAQRLRVIRNHGLLDKSSERIPMSVFVLLPQFILLGAVDGFTNSGIKRFLKDQVRPSMYGYLFYFQRFVIGLGSMASVLWVYVVGKLSEINNNPNWFQHTSNRSRLDRYYWTLAGLSAINFVIWVIVACFYNYKESPLDGIELESE